MIIRNVYKMKLYIDKMKFIVKFLLMVFIRIGEEYICNVLKSCRVLK